MLEIRTLLQRLLGSRRRRRKASAASRKAKSARDERLTVMLVPAAAWGKPIQFQATKRALLAVIAAFACSLLLAVVGIVHFTVSLFGQRDAQVAGSRDSIERQTETTALQQENQKLKKALKLQVEQTQQRIHEVNRLISRISDFTGLPLEAPTTAGAVVVTSGSATALDPPNGLGRGGPLSFSADLLVEGLLDKGSRGYAKALELQLYQLDSIIVRLQRAAGHFSAQQALLATTPLICPAQGDVVVTDRFGERIHPLFRRKDFHAGLDISGPYQSPIIAPADGLVSYAGYDKAMGRTLTIDHGVGLYPRDGVPTRVTFKTRYFHCDRILVKKGVKVKRGDRIALLGSTGTSTGNHLHYEVLVDDKPVDPEFFILNGR